MSGKNVKRIKGNGSLASRVIALIETARQRVATVANVAQVYTNYEIGTVEGILVGQDSRNTVERIPQTRFAALLIALARNVLFGGLTRCC